MTRNVKTTEGAATPFVALPVTGGGVTLVDRDIAAQLAGRRLSRNRAGYVVFYQSGGQRRVHRLVCPPGPGLEVDHINARKDDNRRCNLRAVTHRHNLWCARRRVGRSGYRGVRYDPRVKRYNIVVRWCGATYGARTYASALIAAFVRDDLARQVTGLEEGLNFPRSIRHDELRGFLDALDGRFFGVVFVRRGDGALRRMTCRKGVALGKNGRGLAFDPAQRHLYPIFDVQKRNYRFLPLENVLCDVQKRNYRFLPLENVLCLTCNRTRYRLIP